MMRFPMVDMEEQPAIRKKSDQIIHQAQGELLTYFQGVVIWKKKFTSKGSYSQIRKRSENFLQDFVGSNGDYNFATSQINLAPCCTEIPIPTFLEEKE